MVTADELVKNQRKKDKDKSKIYHKVYERIDKKIIMASQKNFYQCQYEVPEFMLGVPLYDLNCCIKYIQKMLKENGFKTFWDGNIVLIDWSP